MAFPLRVIAGPGLVARKDNFVAAATGPAGSLAPFALDQLFQQYEPGDDGWATLVRRLAITIIEAGFRDHPPVAACEVNDNRLRVFIFGATQVELLMESGERVLLDGGSTSTWIDRQIEASVKQITVGTDPGDLVGSLETGVVPGSGFVAALAASAEASPPQTSEDQTSPETSSEAVSSAVSVDPLPPPLAVPDELPAATPSPFVDSEATIDPSPSYNPKPKLDTSFPRRSSHLAEPAGHQSSESFERLDTDFEPDSTATIGTNELAEIRAAVAASAMAARAQKPAPTADASPVGSPQSGPKQPAAPEASATLLPPPPAPGSTPPPPPAAATPPPPPAPKAPDKPPKAEPSGRSLADLPPPPADYQAPLPPPPHPASLPDPTPARSSFGDSPPPPPSPPALSHRRGDAVDLRDNSSPERSPYAPPDDDIPPPAFDGNDSTIDGSPVRRRGIFAAVPSSDESQVDFSPISVTGVRCPQGHLNRMQTPVCVVCDTAIDAGAPIEQGNRPTLGQLMFDDGTSYPVDRPYIIGRRPESSAPGVGTIFLDDDRHMVSKRHAEIRITGWDVKIVDLDSSNGTKVFPAGGSNQQALRLRPNDEVILALGSHVQIGDRTFQFVK